MRRFNDKAMYEHFESLFIEMKKGSQFCVSVCGVVVANKDE